MADLHRVVVTVNGERLDTTYRRASCSQTSCGTWSGSPVLTWPASKEYADRAPS